MRLPGLLCAVVAVPRGFCRPLLHASNSMRPPLPLLAPRCSELPSSVTGLSRLTELCLQGNPRLALLPDTLGTLPALKDLSAADCALVAVPASLGEAPALETLSLYGNQLYQLPPNLLQARRCCLRLPLLPAVETCAAACLLCLAPMHRQPPLPPPFHPSSRRPS